MNKLIFMLFITVISCSKKDMQNKEINYILSNTVDVNLVDHTENDLLNPSNSAYSIEKIKLYYIIEGEKIEVYDENMDYPRNLSIIHENDKYILRVFTYEGFEGLISENNGIKLGESITLLELDENTTETIVTKWESKENEYFKTLEIIYNGISFNANEIIKIYR